MATLIFSSLPWVRVTLAGGVSLSSLPPEPLTEVDWEGLVLHPTSPTISPIARTKDIHFMIGPFRKDCLRSLLTPFHAGGARARRGQERTVAGEENARAVPVAPRSEEHTSELQS